MTMRLFLFVVLCVWVVPWAPATAQAPTASRCIAYVEREPRIVPAALPAAARVPEVEITYVTHSTFRLRSPAGVIIATDYSGYYGEGRAPDVATMNHAHETHYTDYPDPEIAHVLRGWNPDGDGPAKHHLVVGDVLVRNVATDIRSVGGLVEPYGNSIFIFETADLCIGHLGHLHHMPTRDQFAQIGRLDIVFAAVDGGLTLDHPTLIAVLKELRASLVIPMHFFGRGSLEAFLIGMSSDFEIKVNDSATTTVTLPGLPRRPTVLVLPGY